MAFILKATQNVELSVTIADKKGNASSVQNGVWANSGEGVVAVTDNGNNSATVSAIGTPGMATITYTADADLGEGVKSVVGTVDIEVVAGDAAVFNIVPGVPSEQSDVTPTAPRPPDSPPAAPDAAPTPPDAPPADPATPSDATSPTPPDSNVGSLSQPSMSDHGFVDPSSPI